MNCYSCTLGGRVRYKLWNWASVLNVFHGQWAWFSLVVVALTDLYIRAGRRRNHYRSKDNLLMSSSLPGYEEISTDVLIIGAGGAGLRAAISAAQRGLKVAVICKSLLGKAHTVMAEGGIASSLANVDPDDSWETHFKDTMRGGQMLNNWRMAELLAKESPARVMELERWGMVFDRTTEGKILQRPFGAHTYRRLCHVGRPDRACADPHVAGQSGQPGC